jgi:hypothetical protein
VVHVSPSSRRRLAGGEAPHCSPTMPLTAADLDKIGVSSFYSFEQGLSVLVHFMWQQEAYVSFLEHQNELQKSKQVAQKADVTKKWCWKEWVILVQFVVIAVLWYKIM